MLWTGTILRLSYIFMAHCVLAKKITVQTVHVTMLHSGFCLLPFSFAPVPPEDRIFPTFLNLSPYFPFKNLKNKDRHINVFLIAHRKGLKQIPRENLLALSALYPPTRGIVNITLSVSRQAALTAHL
jgi:hypothetical protein